MNEEKFEKRLIEQFFKLINRADLDMIIYGNAYWEFTDRKIEVINPEEDSLKNAIVQTRKLTKHKINGKSILEREDLK